MSRRSELMEAAAKALRDGIDPFSHGWLVENNVTADECMDLSDGIATAIELALELPRLRDGLGKRLMAEALLARVMREAR